MATLAESIIGGAQNAQTQQGHTVGDAVQAYHIAATAEHARQELDMEKQKQDLSKANWFSQQIDNIGRKVGPAQQMLIDNFGKQAQQIMPGFDPKILDVMKKDPDTVRHMAFSMGNALSGGGYKDPEQADSVLNTFGDVGTFADASEKIGQHRAMIEAAKFKSDGMMGRVNVMQDNQSAQAVDKVVNDPQLKNHTQRIQGADRILGQLDDVRSGKMVDTNQFLNDMNTEYVNLLTGANNSALGKQERTEYRTYAGDIANVMQKIKADPTSINSPKILTQIETGVNGMKGAYQRNFDTRADVLQRTYAHNPNATQQQQQAIQSLKQQYGAQANAPQAPASNVPAIGAEHDYHGKTYVYQGGDVNDQKNWKEK